MNNNALIQIIDKMNSIFNKHHVNKESSVDDFIRQKRQDYELENKRSVLPINEGLE